MSSRRPLLSSLLLLAATCVGTTCGAAGRPDDALEPNDSSAQATRLAPGEPLEARANEGDVDVFAVEAPAGAVLAFSLESRGLENCAAFTVTGPDGEVLFEDTHTTCGRKARRPRRSPGAELLFLDVVASEAGAYALRVPTRLAGRYLLTVRELGEGDNLFPYSWDYRLTASVE